jgi:cardiolipin synthase
MSIYKPLKLADGNIIQILFNADEAYPAMLAAIAAAQTSIKFANYCMLPGVAFQRFSQALAEAASRGVRVQMVLDAYYSRAIRDRQYSGNLLAAGTQLRWRRRFQPLHPLRYNHGLHKKLLIIDNKIGFTGGVGVGDFWQQATLDYPAPWRDTHFGLIGPVVAAMTAAFEQSWEGSEVPARTSCGEITAINSQPSHWPQLSTVGETMIDLIKTTQHRLNITTAYFNPSRPAAEALQQAAGRNVQVGVLTNGPHCTHPSARNASRHGYAPLLEAGIHIYEYQPSLIHAKIITSDDTTSLIGSANLNFRSLYHDEEFSLLVRGPKLAAQLGEQFRCDLQQAPEITRQRWAHRRAPERLRQATASLARYIF